MTVEPSTKITKITTPRKLPNIQYLPHLDKEVSWSSSRVQVAPHFRGRIEGENRCKGNSKQTVNVCLVVGFRIN